MEIMIQKKLWKLFWVFILRQRYYIKEDGQLVEKIASMTEEEYKEYFDGFDKDEAYQDDFFSNDLPF